MVRSTISLRTPRTIKEAERQSGRIINFAKDQSRRALPPGKRISKYGNVYWETRFNRTDKTMNI